MGRNCACPPAASPFGHEELITLARTPVQVPHPNSLLRLEAHRHVTLNMSLGHAALLPLANPSTIILSCSIRSLAFPAPLPEPREDQTGQRSKSRCRTDGPINRHGSGPKTGDRRLHIPPPHPLPLPLCWPSARLSSRPRGGPCRHLRRLAKNRARADHGRALAPTPPTQSLPLGATGLDSYG